MSAFRRGMHGILLPATIIVAIAAAPPTSAPNDKVIGARLQLALLDKPEYSDYMRRQVRLRDLAGGAETKDAGHLIEISSTAFRFTEPQRIEVSVASSTDRATREHPPTTVATMDSKRREGDVIARLDRAAIETGSQVIPAEELRAGLTVNGIPFRTPAADLKITPLATEYSAAVEIRDPATTNGGIAAGLSVFHYDGSDTSLFMKSEVAQHSDFSPAGALYVFSTPNQPHSLVFGYPIIRGLVKAGVASGLSDDEARRAIEAAYRKLRGLPDEALLQSVLDCTAAEFEQANSSEQAFEIALRLIIGEPLAEDAGKLTCANGTSLYVLQAARKPIVWVFGFDRSGRCVFSSVFRPQGAADLSREQLLARASQILNVDVAKLKS